MRPMTTENPTPVPPLRRGFTRSGEIRILEAPSRVFSRYGYDYLLTRERRLDFGTFFY